MGAVAALAMAGLTGCSPSAAEPFVPAGRAPDASAAPGPGDTPRPGDATGPADPAASPGSSQSGGTGPETETVQAAPGVRVVVEPPESPDPDAAGAADMVGAFRDYYVGSLRAIASGGADDDYLGVLSRNASRQGYEWVHGYVKDGRELRGTVRLYGFDVSSVTGRGSQLDVCVDMSGMRAVDARTGKAVPEQEAWMRKPFFQAAGMRKDDDGVRRITNLRYALPPNERAKGCLR
ncbi:hypothetical protein HS041_09385 [Planomonospora sp. ID67723]|uniref:hypothetical protein n=1 Tax=Planomonospora sp. ID67723 TaxID=2738134 RepID=UPI0018C3981E|nr:hypothetical protein [Planomonospora sp. ID67723]MBG0827978.1 hypothetical protein [Planomonospora sp. ID67723]